MPLLHIGKYGDLRTLAWLVSARARLRPFSTDPPAVPADRAGPPAMAGLHPGRGPGRPDRGPGHTPLAGRSNGPDRRPWSWGGEDHEATRPGKGGSRLLARNRPLSGGGPCRGAVRAPGYAARVRHRQTPTSGLVTGQALADHRELLARHGIEPSHQESARATPGTSRALVGCMRVSTRTTCCKSNDSRHDHHRAPDRAPRAR